MARRIQFGSLALVVLLLAQPLSAVAACWQNTTERADCTGHCNMPRQPQPVEILVAEASVPVCCEISASNPTETQATLGKLPGPSSFSPAAQQADSVNLPVLTAKDTSGIPGVPLIPESESQALLCVFLN